MEKRDFVVLIERDEDGNFIAEIPNLKGCYTQGETVEEAIKNLKEVIGMCLEEEPPPATEFIGIQKIDVLV